MCSPAITSGSAALSGKGSGSSSPSDSLPVGASRRRYDGRRMYAVIMAGGGGTRLHPLSRPERPKPFLPLLGASTLLQATARRLPTEDITVVTDRRYERLVRDQLPDAHILTEPMGRNTAAAIALATAP